MCINNILKLLGMPFISYMDSMAVITKDVFNVRRIFLSIEKEGQLILRAIRRTF